MTRPRSRHRLLMARHLALLSVVAVMPVVVLAPAVTPARAATVVSAASAACRNLPLSSALLTARECAPMGDNATAVAGVNPTDPSEGMAALLDDRQRSVVRFANSGALHLGAAGASFVCLSASTGASTGLDVATAHSTTAAVSACHANGRLSVTGTTTSPTLAPTQSPARAAATRGPRLSATDPPAASYSYYVATSFISKCLGAQTSTCPLWQMGADESVPSGGALIIVDFGAPCQDPATGNPGVQTFFQRTCYDYTYPQRLFQKFIAGYEATHGSGTPASIIAAGVSNSVNGIAGDAQTAGEMGNIGWAWAKGVVQATSTVGLAAPVTAWGAIDAEEAGDGNWLGPVETRAFVDAFGAGTNHTTGAFPCNTSTAGMLADFGDAVFLERGYDRQYPYGWGPSGGWTADDIYHVSWGASSACNVPEIYYDINAEEWASLSDYEVKKGRSAMGFVGVMSENGVDGTNGAAQSYSSIVSWTHQNVAYLTNIAWSISVVPAQLNSLQPTQTTTEFPVSWQVASGIANASYIVYSSEDGAAWLQWLATVGSTATFDGRAGHHYDFFIQTVGPGFNNGGPGTAQTGTGIDAAATRVQPVQGFYSLDFYGGVHPASSPPVSISAYWGGWNICRGMALNQRGDGGLVLDAFGGLHPFGNQTDLANSNYWRGWDIARGVALLPSGAGGYMLDGYGGIHPVGSAPALGGGSYWRGWDIARAIVLLPSGTGGYVLDGFGGLHNFGGAPPMATSAYWGGWDIARSVALTADGKGAYVLDGYGGLHAAGNAAPVDSPVYWAGWNIARSVVLVPGSNTQGYVVDGYNGVHPFGGAPSLNSYTYYGSDLTGAAAAA